MPPLDELFVAVLRRRAQPNVERMAEALVSDEPLRAWWELAYDTRGTALFVELLAAANHRPALRAEVATFARVMRAMQMQRLATLLAENGVDADRFPPALVAAALQGLAFGLVTDQAAGYDTATDEAAAAMGRLVAELEHRRAQPPRPGRRARA